MHIYVYIKKKYVMHYTQAVVSLKEIKAFWSACVSWSRGGRYPQPKKRRSGGASESAVSCGRHGNWNLPVESAKIWRLVKVDELLLKDHLRLYLGFRKWRLNLKFPLEYCDRLLASEWRNIASYRSVRTGFTVFRLTWNVQEFLCVCVL